MSYQDAVATMNKDELMAYVDYLETKVDRLLATVDILETDVQELQEREMYSFEEEIGAN